MPICPNCRTNQTRRRDGVCPACGTPIKIHKGFWYRDTQGSPPSQLLKFFLGLVSDNISRDKQFRVQYEIPEKSLRWVREMVLADRILLKTDGDIELAKETIQTLFTEKQWSWKTYTSLGTIYADFDLALALVKSRRVALKKIAAKERSFAEKVQNKEDIFS